MRVWFFGLIFIASAASAQTVTGSGTSGTLPVFTNSSTIGNSSISVSGSDVGIGTTSPTTTLDIRGPMQSLSNWNGSLPTITPSVSVSGGTLLGWNGLSADAAETDVVNVFRNPGNTYSGGFAFFNMASSTAIATTPLMFITASGSVGIGTTTPAASLDIAPGILHVGGAVNPTTASQGAYVGWNAMTGGTGETDLINNPGGGSGGFAFMTVPASGSPRNTVMKISSSGAVTFADGTSQTTAWTGVLCGGDYAEAVNVGGDRKHYEPGDVLVIDPDAPGKFLKSAEPYSTAVTGIYATKPGVIGRRQTMDTATASSEVPMAMVGIVPTKVSAENGPIKPGDLLVTASTIGYAMRGTDRSRLTGAVIAKALGTLNSGTGVIEAVVTLQ